MPQQADGATADDDHAQYNGSAIDRLLSFAKLNAQDKERLSGMAGATFQLKRGQPIRSDDDAPWCLHLLLEGWAANEITLANGSRQLTSISLPGDLLGLPTLAVATPIDVIVALNTVTVCSISLDAFVELFMSQPRLAKILFLLSQEERMLAMERLALMGGAPARARLAALFVRLQERVSQGSGEPSLKFAFPLTQLEMGDLIGVSAVHVNALLKQMRAQEIVAIDRRQLHILDFDRLIDLAGVLPWARSEPFLAKGAQSRA